VRRIRNKVARSERGSAEGRRADWREMGVSILGMGSVDAVTCWEETLDVGRDLGRGWNLDIGRVVEMRRQRRASPHNIVSE